MLETLGNLEVDLEPVIPTRSIPETDVIEGGVERTGFYQEEAEYLDLGPDGLDLVPQIESSTLESPPPYSEVDPRLLPRPTLASKVSDQQVPSVSEISPSSPP